MDIISCVNAAFGHMRRHPNRLNGSEAIKVPVNFYRCIDQHRHTLSIVAYMCVKSLKAGCLLKDDTEDLACYVECLLARSLREEIWKSGFWTKALNVESAYPVVLFSNIYILKVIKETLKDHVNVGKLAEAYSSILSKDFFFLLSPRYVIMFMDGRHFFTFDLVHCYNVDSREAIIMLHLELWKFASLDRVSPNEFKTTCQSHGFTFSKPIKTGSDIQDFLYGTYSSSSVYEFFAYGKSSSIARSI